MKHFTLLQTTKYSFVTCAIFMSLASPAFSADIGLFVNGGAQWGINPGGGDQRSGAAPAYYSLVLNQADYSLLSGQTEGTWSNGVFSEAMKASSSARAYFGMLGVRSFSWANAASEYGDVELTHLLEPRNIWLYQAYANAVASFSDVWRVDAGILNGTTGTLKVGVLLEGTRSAAYEDHPASLSLSLINYGNGQTAYNDIFAGQYELVIPFRYGVDNNIRMSLNSFAGAATRVWNFYYHQLARGGSQDVDFYNTALTNSFAFYDAGGNPVTEYTFTTGSGHDYSASIPEPASFLVFCSGFAGLVLLRRQSSREEAR